MSAIDRVREKFKVPMSGTSKTSKSPSAGSAVSPHRDSEKWEPVSAQPTDPAVQALEARRQKVEAQLLANPKLRMAADVTDAPMRPEAGRPVSIVVAIKTPQGIVSGELEAPRERFDTGVFFAYLREIGEPS
jgi:hypothetical protein